MMGRWQWPSALPACDHQDVSSDGFGVGAGVFVGVCTFLALLSDHAYVHFTSVVQLHFVGVEDVCFKREGIASA